MDAVELCTESMTVDFETGLISVIVAEVSVQYFPLKFMPF